MDHVARCSDCARFWEDLHGAQELAMGLPEARVGSRFRDEVWQRIQAGEGAPDNIAQEPVPVLTKIRYGVFGAAAAAVFILAVHFGFRPAVHEPAEPNGEDVANIVNEPPVTPPAMPVVADLTAANLAAHTANQVSIAARSLRSRSRTLTDVKQLRPEVIRDVRENIETVRSGLVILKRLRIEFRNNDARDCLTRVLTTLEFHQNLEQPEQVRQTLHAISGCSFDRLQESLLFNVTHNRPPPPEFFMWLNEHPEQNRIIRHMVMLPDAQQGEFRFFWIVGTPPPAQPTPPQKIQSRKLRERTPR
jgi:hypothetical protein